MAVSDYADRGQVKSYLKIASDATYLDEWIDMMIPVISRQIDDHCHRHFYPKTETRTFDYQTAKKLFFKADLNSVTEIQHGTNTTEVLDSSHYFLYPEVGPPYQWLEINTSSTVQLRFSQYTEQQSIKITGVWGYLEDGETPNRVMLACCAWISYIHQLGKNAGVKSKSIGDYSVTYANTLDALKDGPPNEVAFALKSFVKRTTFASNLRYKG